MITNNQASRLQVSVTGPATLSFTWKVESESSFDFLSVEVDGQRPIPSISGSVDWQRQTLALDAGTHTVQWIYAKDGSVSVGRDTGWLDEVAIGPAAAAPPPAASALAQATDATAAISLTTAGDGMWASQTAVTHDGIDAAQSGRITHNQESRMDARLTGPATLAFWWKVDSEARFDFLNVTLDGVTALPGISGSVDWQQQTIQIPAGAHTVRWTYSKDISVSMGQDAAWVDQVTLQ